MEVFDFGGELLADYKIVLYIYFTVVGQIVVFYESETYSISNTENDNILPTTMF